MIDPGHGGSDPGAVGQNGLREKDVNLSVARMLKTFLEEAGYEVRLTRNGDEYVSLLDRCRKANNWGSDLFISVHCNAASNPKALGIETYHFPKSTDGKRLAKEIQASLITTTARKDRGIKEAQYQVLKGTAMPAVLVELGFVSNEEEENLLRDLAFQDICARAIAHGIKEYFLKGV